MSRAQPILGSFWLVALAALLLLTACGGEDGSTPDQLPDPVSFDGEMVMPDGWQGVWDLTFDLINPENDRLVARLAPTLTICAGDTLSLFFGPILGNCDGYVRGDSLVFEAQESWTEELCDVTMIFELNSKRSGDLISGAGEWRIEMSGTCGTDGSTAGRELIQFNGVRTGDVPEGHCQ